MKLLYDYQIFVSQQYGGISRYFFELISRLALKEELFMYQGFYNNEYGLESMKSKYTEYYGFKKPTIPKTARIFSFIDFMLFRYYFAPKADADIYHPTYYSDILPYFKGARIVTVYDLIREIYAEQFIPNTEIHRKKNLINISNGIISISLSTKKDLINIYNIPEEKIEVIYLANSLKTEVESKRLITEDYILYVGARRGYKNFDLLLKAYATSKLINNRCVLVCFGGGALTKEEKKYISELGITGKVMHCSGSDQTLANLYKYAGVFVYPSLYEGFGIPPLEAMYYGCPVVASNSSSIPEVVGNAGLYFEPSSCEDLIYKIERILGNTSLREDIINKGYEQEKKFTWEKCAQETYSYYKSIIG